MEIDLPQEETGTKFFIGFFWGIVASLPVWIVIIFLMGCASPMTIKANCWHRALATGIVIESEGYPVRIVGSCNKLKICHVQTQAQVDRKWLWASPGDKVVAVDNIADPWWADQEAFTQLYFYTLQDGYRMWVNE